MNIDFVIPWVDGNDSKWIIEKKKWEDTNNCCNSIEANTECRYRSNDMLLRYWFRGVESFAPWVNKIHFVTCGQKPYWLNENHPKLNLVNHEDYIPSQYLPTFNSNTIELNFHRIKELSENFVYFNDDMFLLQHVEPNDFFKDGKPILDANLRYAAVKYSNWSRIIFNDYCIINNSFDLNKSIWQNRRKWFNLCILGWKRVRRNFVCYLANKTLPVGMYGHIALPHLKSTIEEVWEKQYDIMNQTCKHKFRNDDQVNQWLMCAWNQAKGYFSPVNIKNIGAGASLQSDTVDWLYDLICKQSVLQICINDTPTNIQSEDYENKIIQAFETILPEKSKFEIE